MQIVEEVRKYDSLKSMNAALGQFRRHKYPSIIHTQESDNVYAIKVTKHYYPFVESVIRKLQRIEAKHLQMIDERIGNVMKNIRRRVA
jgi:hypothetical protein